MPISDQGIDRAHYLVVPRTLIFLFDSNNQVLLLKGAENKRLWAGLYNGIGGHIEAGEYIYEAAYRELREEAGITRTTLQYCGQITIDTTTEVGVAIFIFKGEYQYTSFANSSEGSLAWIAFNCLHDIPLVEDLPKLIPLLSFSN